VRSDPEKMFFSIWNGNRLSRIKEVYLHEHISEPPTLLKAKHGCFWLIPENRLNYNQGSEWVSGTAFSSLITGHMSPPASVMSLKSAMAVRRISVQDSLDMAVIE